MTSYSLWEKNARIGQTWYKMGIAENKILIKLHGKTKKGLNHK